MVGIGRIEVGKTGIEIWQAEVAAIRSIGEWYKVRVQDRHCALVYATNEHPRSSWYFQVRCRSKKSARRRSQGWAVGVLRTQKRCSARSAHVTEVEVLVNCASNRANLQVFLDSLCRQDQAALLQSRNRLVVLCGRLLQADFLGEEEKCLVFLRIENAGNVEWTADRTPKILPAIERSAIAKR